MNTLRNWDRTGYLTAVRVGPRGIRKYRNSDAMKHLYGNKRHDLSTRWRLT